MGVIRNLTSLQNGFEDSIEDVLEEIEAQLPSEETESRRVRKVKHRSKPHAVGGVNQNTRSKSGKKKKRIDNSNYLLSLADPEEVTELSIHDFIPPTISVFSKIYFELENMEMWNDFINCTDLEGCLQAITSQSKAAEPSPQPDVKAEEQEDNDKRAKHPAYSAAECFRRIDTDLRCLLRKKHVPMGPLMYLERELITFFVNRPQNIYHSHIPNSFQRLLLHALCQYLDLSALSYNRNGARWTRVRNNKPCFTLPVILLSTFLEQRIHKTPIKLR